MKTTKLALMLAAVSLGACATDELYRKTLDTWVGAGESELVARWGAAHSVGESGGARTLTYATRREMTVPGTPMTYSMGSASGAGGVRVSAIPIGGTPARTITVTCETTFVVKNGRVESVGFKGDDCAAAPAK